MASQNQGSLKDTREEAVELLRLAFIDLLPACRLPHFSNSMRKTILAVELHLTGSKVN